MINVPDKPVSKKTRRWPMWAVIRTDGRGSTAFFMFAIPFAVAGVTSL